MQALGREGGFNSALQLIFQHFHKTRKVLLGDTDIQGNIVFGVVSAEAILYRNRVDVQFG